MRWHTLWYNRAFSVALCICLSVLIIVGLVGNLSDFGGPEATLSPGWAFLIGLVLSAVVSALVHVITYLETVKVKRGGFRLDSPRAREKSSEENLP